VVPIAARNFAQSDRALVELVPADAAIGAKTATATRSTINLFNVLTPDWD
jgi:hypothetical protein